MIDTLITRMDSIEAILSRVATAGAVDELQGFAYVILGVSSIALGMIIGKQILAGK